MKQNGSKCKQFNNEISAFLRITSRGRSQHQWPSRLASSFPVNKMPHDVSITSQPGNHTLPVGTHVDVKSSNFEQRDRGNDDDDDDKSRIKDFKNLNNNNQFTELKKYQVTRSDIVYISIFQYFFVSSLELKNLKNLGAFTLILELKSTDKLPRYATRQHSTNIPNRSTRHYRSQTR